MAMTSGVVAEMAQHLPQRVSDAADQALRGKLCLGEVRDGDSCTQHPQEYGGSPAHRRIPVVLATLQAEFSGSDITGHAIRKFRSALN
jgi:hypothetical protein